MMRYGPIPIDRADIRTVACMSIDLRTETGAVGVTDETRTVPAGTFTLAVFGDTPDATVPVGEVRCMVNGREVSIVGELTGRAGVAEVTPDHVAAALNDPDGYRRQIAAWLGVAA
ncbi:MAG: hypothetical protein CMB99_01080 [Flavobacteriaceae bacterium]|nr:hypothetical protein [Flavobacteriaceae bacterium]